MGDITAKDGVVEQSNIHDYPMSRMHQVPDIEVHYIKSNDAPAICSAMFAATGQRTRKLPLKKRYSV